jgi:cytochrome c551/c552
MKHLIRITTILLLSVTPGLAGEAGETVFHSLKCGICHKADTGKTNPSLKDLSQAYNEKEDRLVQYLKGEADPLVASEKAEIMKRYLEKTRALSDVDRSALAKYIIGF